MGQSPEILTHKLLRIKHFHGVSSGNQHPYLLKSRYGKVRFVLIHISEGLIDAAIDFWAESRQDSALYARENVRDQARRNFLRAGEKTFLLLIKPIIAEQYPEWWAMQIESIIKSINIMTIDNEVRGVIRNEVTLDQRMDINSSIVSGVVYVFSTGHFLESK